MSRVYKKKNLNDYRAKYSGKIKNKGSSMVTFVFQLLLAFVAQVIE